MKNKSKKPRPFLIEPILKQLARCSLSCLFGIARVLGFIMAHTKNQISKQTRDNIELCFSDKNKSQQKQLYRESITHTACALIEMASLWHQPMDKVLSLIKSEHVSEEYRKDERAKIIIAPHFGSWELLNLWLARQGTLFALYKPSRSAKVDQYILQKRTRNGAILVGTNTIGLRSLLKGLKSGASVMILPDQRPSNESAKINSQFYGHEASTSLLIKNLAKKVDCSVYIAAAIRHLDKPSYSIQLNKLDEAQFSAEDQQSADFLNQSIEDFIKVDESQYQWSYQRFG